MAQRVEVVNIDDLTGEAGDDVKPVEFGLDGVNYEIDLDDPNEEKLRNALAQFTAVARRVGSKGTVTSIRAGRVRSQKKSSKNPSEAKKEQNARIREWARSQGYQLSTHGRITNAAREAYFAEFYTEREVAE